MRHLLIHSLAGSLALSLALGGCIDSAQGPSPDPDPGQEPGTEPDPGTEPEPADIDLMAQWAACMTAERWEQANMDIWASKTTSFAANCADCHGEGLARFYAGTDPDMMFEYNRYPAFITGFFTVGVDTETGDTVVIPAYAKLTNKAKGANVHPLYAHGDGQGRGDPAFEALERFYQLTRQYIDSGNCTAAPEYPPLPQPEPEPEPDL